MADSAPVVVREVDGDLVLVLAGPDLPERGVVVGVTQRRVVTRYPGRSTASTQMMGTEDRPIVLRGVFSDALQQTAGHALAQAERARRLALRQRLCEFEWGETVVRRGYVDFEPEIERDGVIRYQLTFEVAQSFEADELTTVDAPAPELAVELDATDADIDNVEAALQSLGLNPTGDLTLD